jgi:predicted ester cyclase
MRMAAVTVALALEVSLCAVSQAGTADNVRTATRVFLEYMAEGRFRGSGDVYGPNFVAHGASFRYTLEQDQAATLSWRAAMPDLKVTVERTVADKDLVAVHWKAVGTNTVAAGEMPGKGDRVGVEGMTLFRFAAGRIVEEWSVIDVATLRKELS